MKYHEKNIATKLSGAALMSIAASLFVSNIVLAQTAPKIETVVTLGQDTNGQVENIAEGPDGAMYVTAAFDRVLWRVKDGKAERFFSSPKHAVMSGVAWDRNELVVSLLDKSPFPPRGAGPAPGQGGQGQGGQGQGGQGQGQRAAGDGQGQGQGGGQRAGGGPVFARDIGPHSFILDRSGKVKATVDGENSSFFNGLTRAGDNWFLIADGGLLSLDTKAKTITPWFMDPQIRTNGVKVNKGWVYLVSGGNVYRIQIGPDRKPMGGAVMFAQGAQTDDFGVAPDGTIYIPSGKTMVKVSPSGERSVFLEDIETTNSPAAVVTRDGKWLYWIERAGPAKVKRVSLK